MKILKTSLRRNITWAGILHQRFTNNTAHSSNSLWRISPIKSQDSFGKSLLKSCRNISFGVTAAYSSSNSFQVPFRISVSLVLLQKLFLRFLLDSYLGQFPEVFSKFPQKFHQRFPQFFFRFLQDIFRGVHLGFLLDALYCSPGIPPVVPWETHPGVSRQFLLQFLPESPANSSKSFPEILP